MSEYVAIIEWNREGGDFAANTYSRGHTWSFDGGLVVPASSAPDVVPVPQSIAENVDPEEAFIASLSSCHMLWFLAIAGKSGYIVDDYRDEASGIMAKKENGKLAITEVSLKPKTSFSGDKIPDREQLEKLHEKAHRNCFIANSVNSEIKIILD